MTNAKTLGIISLVITSSFILLVLIASLSINRFNYNSLFAGIPIIFFALIFSMSAKTRLEKNLETESKKIVNISYWVNLILFILLILYSLFLFVMFIILWK